MSNLVDVITASHVESLLSMDNPEKKVKLMQQHQEALREECTKEKRWKDGRGIIHELRPRVEYNVAVTSTVVWRPTCGYRYTSRVTHPQYKHITCFACLHASPQAYMCRVCGHAEPEHDNVMCHDCAGQDLPVPCTGFIPDYRYPYEPEER